MPALDGGTDQPPQAQALAKKDPNVSRLKFEGREYVKINLGESLYLAEKQPAKALAGNWVFRGMVRRSPELDKAGKTALLRTMIFCCLADGVMVC